jgi:predicted RNA-binding Zn ribbon-like protein
MGTWKFDLCGGHLALDFANSVSDRILVPVDRLPDFDALVDFILQSGIVTQAQSDTLRAEAAARPAEADSALQDAVALREAIFGVFVASVEGTTPQRTDLLVLNAHLNRFTLNDLFELEWTPRHPGLDDFVGQIVRAAIDLLTTGPRDRVRLCDADDCVWLILDTSKNRSRRWCDMAICGNRAKMRRYHARKKEKKPA